LPQKKNRVEHEEKHFNGGRGSCTKTDDEVVG
jgi:hypothetical protein